MHPSDVHSCARRGLIIHGLSFGPAPTSPIPTQMLEHKAVSRVHTYRKPHFLEIQSSFIMQSFHHICGEIPLRERVTMGPGSPWDQSSATILRSMFAMAGLGRLLQAAQQLLAAATCREQMQSALGPSLMRHARMPMRAPRKPPMQPQVCTIKPVQAYFGDESNVRSQPLVACVHSYYNART